MNLDGSNPSKVQMCPPAKRLNPPTPLILIHDGGGTIFSYFIIGPLGREVSAIHDPNYFESKLWEGGMDAMAEHYIGLIEQAGFKGPIMLGGWSLGGFLSLTMARMLADRPDPQFSVAGLLIIDSPYHIARSKITQPTSEQATEKLPELVEKSFDNCDVMLQDWDLPSWEGPSMAGKKVTAQVGTRLFDLEQGKTLYKPLNEPWKTIDHKLYKHQADATSENPKGPPPGVMVRCVQETRKVEGSGQEPCLIDLHRHETLLGWEENYPDFLKAVIDFDAGHYDIFDKFDGDKAKTITQNLKDGLEILDSLQPPTAKPKMMPMRDFF